MTDLTEWLARQLKARSLTEAEFRLAGGIESGTLSNAKSRNSVGPDLAKQIARGLGAPQVWVFYQLGIMDEDPEGLLAQLDSVALSMVGMLDGKTDIQKRAALSTLEALFENLDRGLSGPINQANREIAQRKNQG